MKKKWQKNLEPTLNIRLDKLKKISSLKLSIENSNKCKLSLLNLEQDIAKAIKLIYFSLKKGGKIIICGNGGSAADAQHLVAEFIVRLRPKVNRRPLPAIVLAPDSSTITACGNDYDFAEIFSRPLLALGNKADVLIVISTSGNSKNILNVLKVAIKMKIRTIGFLGCKGGLAKKMCDIKLVVDSKETARIQETHIFLGHYIFEQVENLIIDRGRSVL
jgi:D-sedoheptulose 7-phosphate isomerase